MAQSETGTAAVNPDLAQLHAMLIALVSQLDSAVGSAKDAAEVKGLLDQIAEVNARATNVGWQLFTQQTAQITAGVTNVMTQKQAALDAIEKLESVKAVADAVGGLLSVVDQVIDVARLAI
jgi:conjugal transfer/entry exclusion protein